MAGETHISSTHAQIRSPLTNLFPLHLKINSPDTENNFILTRSSYTDQRLKMDFHTFSLLPLLPSNIPTPHAVSQNSEISSFNSFIEHDCH